MNRYLYCCLIIVFATHLESASQDSEGFKRYSSLVISGGISISDCKIESPSYEQFKYWPSNASLVKVSEKRGRVFPKARWDVGVQRQLSKSAAIAFSIGYVSTVFRSRIKEFYPTQDYSYYPANHPPIFIAANDTFAVEETYGVTSLMFSGSYVVGLGSNNRHFLGAGLRYNQGFDVFAHRTYSDGYVDQGENISSSLSYSGRASITLEYRFRTAFTERLTLYLLTEADYSIPSPWRGGWFMSVFFDRTVPDFEFSHIVGLNFRAYLSFSFI